MDDYEKSRALIRRVLDSGRRPLILWMYLDDVAKAVERMFRRAQAIGRTDQLDHITSAYKQVPEVLSALGREFPTSVSIYIADNSRNRCEQEFVQSRVLGYDTQLASEVAQAQVWSVNQMFHDKPTFEVAY
jgi:hypothetical protein